MLLSVRLKVLAFRDTDNQNLQSGTAEVPNHFMYAGPYSGYGHGAMVPVIENTTRYILKVIEKAQVEDIKRISLKKQSAEDFTKHANLWLSTTTWSAPCTSWYKSGTDKKSAPMFPGTRTLCKYYWPRSCSGFVLKTYARMTGSLSVRSMANDHR